MREKEFKVICTKPYVYCKVFEDNSGTLELALLLKLCPRTNHKTFVTIVFMNMCKRGLLRFFQLAQKTRFLMHS